VTDGHRQKVDATQVDRTQVHRQEVDDTQVDRKEVNGTQNGEASLNAGPSARSRGGAIGPPSVFSAPVLSAVTRGVRATLPRREWCAFP
jgi:hypothetical protein